MKKTYKIEVDCPNCAAKMEEAARKIHEESRFALVSHPSQRNNSTSLSVLNTVRTFNCCV